MYKNKVKGHDSQQRNLETDFMAAATEADQRRFQQFSGGNGIYPGASYLNQPHNKNNALDQMQTRSSQQANHSAQMAESQTSLNNAKSILSQVLNNLNHSNVSSNQPMPTMAYGDGSLR